MAAEGILSRADASAVVVSAVDAAVPSGEVRQMKDGRAGVAKQQVAADSGDPVVFETAGIYKMVKTTNAYVALEGNRAYWDHSANVVHYKKVNDKDFYLGRFAKDATAAATEVYVNLNIDPPYDVDMLGGEGGFLSVPTGTQAVGGFGFPKPLGKSMRLNLTSTNEAQCIDMLSVDKFAIASNFIAEFVIRPDVNGSGAAVDFNLGVANGTSTTDADATTEHVLFHIDGASTTILLQSADGTTTNAAATTATTITAGSAVANRKEFWIDARDHTDIQCYVDGALVIAGTAFTLGGGTGPVGLLVHLEKTSDAATGQFTVDRACARLAQQ